MKYGDRFGHSGIRVLKLIDKGPWSIVMAARLTLTDHREGKVSGAASQNYSMVFNFGSYLFRAAKIE